VGDEGGVGIVFTNRYTLVNAKFAAKKTNTVILFKPLVYAALATTYFNTAETSPSPVSISTAPPLSGSWEGRLS